MRVVRDERSAIGAGGERIQGISDPPTNSASLLIPLHVGSRTFIFTVFFSFPPTHSGTLSLGQRELPGAEVWWTLSSTIFNTMRFLDQRRIECANQQPFSLPLHRTINTINRHNLQHAVPANFVILLKRFIIGATPRGRNTHFAMRQSQNAYFVGSPAKTSSYLQQIHNRCWT